MFQEKNLAQNIILHRQKRGMSQQDLAQQLFVTAQSVSKWERGESRPDIVKLCKLAEIFEISVDSLLSLDQAERKKYMVAIDGGGTKTEFLLLDMQGIIQKRLVLGGTNPNTSSLDGACSVLQQGISALYMQQEQMEGIFAGIAGCGAEKNKAAIESFLQEKYPDAKIRCDTDVRNVIGCFPEVENCVLAICGTGSVVYSRENDCLHRLGGWGYLLDSDGSGFGIGNTHCMQRWPVRKVSDRRRKSQSLWKCG